MKYCLTARRLRVRCGSLSICRTRNRSALNSIRFGIWWGWNFEKVSTKRLGRACSEAIGVAVGYRITRAEHRLLIAHADERRVPRSTNEPARFLSSDVGQRGEGLRASPTRFRTPGGSARVQIIDISSKALEKTEQRPDKA